MNNEQLDKTYRFSGLILLVALLLHLLIPLKCLVDSFQIAGKNKIEPQVVNRDKATNSRPGKIVNTEIHKIDICCEQANLFSVYHEASGYNNLSHFAISLHSMSLAGLNIPYDQNQVSRPHNASPPSWVCSRPVYLVNSTFLN